MSGPYDRPEDPEDVTLWAGRLRAWPTPPVAPAEGEEWDDDTAVSPRRDLTDDTVRSVRGVPVEDTLRVPREPARMPEVEPESESMVEPEPEPDPVPTTEPRAVPEPASDPAHATGTAAGAPDADETVRVPRARVVTAPVAAGPLDETTAPGRRRGAAPAEPAPAAPEDDAPTGDTAAGTRRARSRVRDETPEIPSGDPVPRPREARLPDADREMYRPRVDDAVRVARSAPPSRPTDAPDAADVRPRTPRRARRRGVLLAVTIVVVVAAAAIALFLVMG